MSGTALVTGAASGIGAAIAHELTSAGWRVAGYDLHDSPTELSLIGDTTDPGAAEQAVIRTVDTLGPIDALVNSAGHYEMVPFEQITPAQWARMLAVHLGGFVTMARAVLPGMLARNAGSIVAVVSELALGGGEQVAHYAAAKGAVIGLVKSLAVEVAPHGVLVNAVAPGPTDTPLIPSGSPERGPQFLSTLPAGRLADPREIAAATRFVIEGGTFMAGEVLSPNSGAVI